MADEFEEEPGKTLFSSRRGRRRVPGRVLAGLGLLAVIGAVAGAVWIWSRAPETGAMGPLGPLPADSVRPVTEEPFVLPALGASDAAVRGLVAGSSAHPQLAAWLVPDDLIRRFVEAVVDLSRKSSPLPAMEMLIPEEAFGVQPLGDGLVMDSRSQERYDLLREVFGSVDANAAAGVYRQLLPLFEEAYAELGVADGPFEEVLARAVGNLLAVEVPEGPLEVREAVGRYVYVDRRIESLTPAEKHLVRMGPENAGRVQEKLLEISQALGLPPVPAGR
jgi:hypothetical protein